MKNFTLYSSLAAVALMLLTAGNASAEVNPPYTQLNPTGYNIPSNYLSNTGNEGYAKLFDQDRGTKWCIVNTTGSWQTVTVDFESDVYFIPNAYYLTPGSDTYNNTNRNPKVWKLYGKARQIDDWTVLGNVTDGGNLGTDNGTDYRYDINTNKPFKYFRFEIIETCGKNYWDNNWTFQLAELQFTGTIANFVKGDLNLDGVVDIADLNSLINVMLGTEPMVNSADINDDGSVDVADLNHVINVMLGIIVDEITVYDEDNIFENDFPVFGLTIDQTREHRMIYLKTELTKIKGQTIKKIRFYPQNTLPQWGNTIEVLLKEISEEEFDIHSNNTWAEGGTHVATLTNAGATQYFDFEFDTPFEYKGNNLLVKVNVVTPGIVSDANFYTGSAPKYVCSSVGSGGVYITYLIPKATFYCK